MPANYEMVRMTYIKQKMQYSYVSLLNKHQNLSDHERENLVLNQNYGTKDGSVDTSYTGRMTVYKHLEDLPDTS